MAGAEKGGSVVMNDKPTPQPVKPAATVETTVPLKVKMTDRSGSIIQFVQQSQVEIYKGMGYKVL